MINEADLDGKWVRASSVEVGEAWWGADPAAETFECSVPALILLVLLPDDIENESYVNSVGEWLA